MQTAKRPLIFPRSPISCSPGNLHSPIGNLSSSRWPGFCSLFSLALLLNQVRLQFGWPACLIATLILVADGVIFQSTLFRAGDPLITALIVLAFIVFVHGVNSASVSRRSIWTWPIAGALLGATALFQPATNYWLLCIMLIWLGYGVFQLVRRKSWGPPPEAFFLFWIGVFVVAAPWWIRNCKTTREFKPLGHAVGINLVGAYCDQSATAGGNLSVGTIVSVRNRELRAAKFADTELVEKEAYLSEIGVSTASQWIADHPEELPQLIVGRVANHFGLTQHQAPQQIAFNAVVLLGALVGCLFSWRRWGGIILMLIVISTLVTAATWSDFGRQLIPLRALIDVAFAIGVVSLIGLLSKRQRSEITKPNSSD